MRRQRKEKRISKPENIFLIIAVVLGLAFAVFQPLFIEPDASYHFDSATYISNTVVNRAKVGFPAEDYQSTPVPFTTVSTMMKKGTYFKNFFETKLPIISHSKVESRIVQLSWRNKLMHSVAALGVKIGHMIYPSIGAMIITARIFNLIFFIVAMYFIIKKLKVYQWLFVFVSLTPTVIQFVTSLSYDCFNYIVCAWLIATLLNLAADIKAEKELTIKKFFLRIILPSIAVYSSKENSILLFILVAGMLIYLIGKKLKISLSKLQIALGSSFIFILGVVYFFMRYHAHLYLIAGKFFYTFLEPYYTVLTTEVISGTNTAGVPAWLFAVQFAVLILLLLSYTKEAIPRWFAWLSFAVAALNLFGILLQYAVNSSYLTDATITGPQGRYFTVFILLLPGIFTLLSQKISVKSGAWLKKLVVFVIVFVLTINLSVTAVKFYHLQLPADEYRSGVTHYIFK
ncbi:DUF2142 domain-containing protein [Lactococcus nasutitermitis]|uniref:DUF2142 domain-containing protein n=1 Tax=Lactococcus nasutitermitis TaxID=1652957 RepID=A0ABV9JGH1_9LACT|nr:DUF2142 domain-containing protein [Lactococcus nasutitermitis]